MKKALKIEKKKCKNAIETKKRAKGKIQFTFKKNYR